MSYIEAILTIWVVALIIGAISLSNRIKHLELRTQLIVNRVDALTSEVLDK